MSRPGEPRPVDALDAAFRRAAQLAADGDLEGARTVLRRLAPQAEGDGRRLDAGRALRLAAALDRVLGDRGDAVATAARAVELSAGDSDATRAALDELGESLLRAGQSAAAADAFGRAARHAGAHAPPLRRKQAFALAAAGFVEQAREALADLSDTTSSPVDRAALLVQAAAATADHRLWHAADAAVDAAQAPALHADLAFLAAARALDVGDAGLALRQVRLARRYALEAVAPLAYVTASIAESTLSDAVNDDVAAYGSLATGYATLGDLVGRSLSALTFDGPLRELRGRWGSARFAAAKAAYEAARPATDR
ncbi:MAG TPA: hypothetical protein VK453_16910 [Micromonosporaceae bacterium]|nr:hypothetical protein [Micromonosporaceae bacterium]